MGGKKGGLIRKNGKSLDDLARAASEAGYFSGAEKPDVNTLLEKPGKIIPASRSFPSMTRNGLRRIITR